MYSKTEICNIALDNFGCGRISSMEEDTEQARVMRGVYDNARKSLLAKGLWNFATSYEVLNEVADDSLYHPLYTKFYVYPVDAIKIVKILSCDIDFMDRYNYPNFEIMSAKNRRYIATNLQDAKAQLIRDVDNPAIFSPEFVTCFSYLLSARVAEALTRNGQIVREMENKYQEALNQAMLTSAVERQEKTQYPDMFTRFRNSVGHRRYR